MYLSGVARMIDIEKVIELFKCHEWVKFIIPNCGEREYETVEFSSVIEILEKQLDNGWIPVSERLPKREGSYLVTVERTLCNRLEHMTETILYNGDGYWHLFSGRVIAWQSLPEPYREET